MKELAIRSVSLAVVALGACGCTATLKGGPNYSKVYCGVNDVTLLRSDEAVAMSEALRKACTREKTAPVSICCYKSSLLTTRSCELERETNEGRECKCAFKSGRRTTTYTGVACDL